MKKLLLSLALLFTPSLASAATLTLAANPVRVGVGDTVAVTLAVSSVTPVNAFSGTLQIPAGWKLKGISDGNSIVSSWIERPTEASGNVTFAGVTPGSFAGEGGVLFSVLLVPAQAGKAEVSVRDYSVLRGDGTGSAEPVTVKPLALSVVSTPQGGFVEPSDTTPPEQFTIYRTSLDEPSVTFAALDKGSGVDHYEVAETRVPFVAPSTWVVATAPYALTDKAETSDVYVKAVDRAGNERIEKLARAHTVRPYELYIVLAILLIVCTVWWFKRRAA